ncbi:hypothetical protein VTK73DRAFT_7219 [Phialemonium thermophilum]|uniref:Uncharacterized protein n=1 Tax=Phialemonium thermophilum TaxID=223376 RepID=A0ABR3WFN2_9PEZI
MVLSLGIIAELEKFGQPQGHSAIREGFPSPNALDPNDPESFARFLASAVGLIASRAPEQVGQCMPRFKSLDLGSGSAGIDSSADQCAGVALYALIDDVLREPA